MPWPTAASLLAVAMLCACEGAGGTCVYHGSDELVRGIDRGDNCLIVDLRGIDLADGSPIAPLLPLSELHARGGTLGSLEHLYKYGTVDFFEATGNSGGDRLALVGIRSRQAESGQDLSDIQELIGSQTRVTLEDNGLSAVQVDSPFRVWLQILEPTLTSLRVTECGHGSILRVQTNLTAAGLDISVACDVWRFDADISLDGNADSADASLGWLYDLPVPAPHPVTDDAEFRLWVDWASIGSPEPPDNYSAVISGHYLWMVEEGFPLHGYATYSSSGSDRVPRTIVAQEGRLRKMAEGGELVPLED